MRTRAKRTRAALGTAMRSSFPTFAGTSIERKPRLARAVRLVCAEAIIMKILETRVYRGPNLYALWPVIRLHVDLEELEEYPTIKLPGFAQGLLALLPTLAEHTCSYDEPGGFV